MPKMKTNRAAAKRFRCTGSGKFRRAKAGKSHMMFGKSSNRLRNLRKRGVVDHSDERRAREMLPYL